MESSNAKVYIVDDVEAVRESLSLLLDAVGQDNQTSPGANEFLADFSGNMAGALVLDIRMPSMTGLELQRQLNQLHSKLPIIFVTGHGDVPMAVEAMQHGAVDFIQKPYRDQDLLDKINLALSINEEQRDTHTDHGHGVEQCDDQEHFCLQHRSQFRLACAPFQKAATQQAHADTNAQGAKTNQDRYSDRGHTNYKFHY